MIITMKREDIKVTIEDREVVIWLHTSLPEMTEVYAQTIAEKTNVYISDDFIEDHGEEILFTYDETEDVFVLIIPTKISEEIDIEENGIDLSFQYWDKDEDEEEQA